MLIIFSIFVQRFEVSDAWKSDESSKNIMKANQLDCVMTQNDFSTFLAFSQQFIGAPSANIFRNTNSPFSPRHSLPARPDTGIIPAIYSLSCRYSNNSVFLVVLRLLRQDEIAYHGVICGRMRCQWNLWTMEFRRSNSPRRWRKTWSGAACSDVESREDWISGEQE